jgi:FkbM family methyltransferase
MGLNARQGNPLSILNKLVRALARLTYFRRGFYTRFLVAGVERHERLFGKYRFEMDLRLGRLQKIFYLKPGIYEPQTERFIRQNVKPGMIVLDIGANTGYMTILLADLVGAHGQVHSFEPMPASYELLRKNVDGNGLNQVHLHKLALSDRKGEATLHVDPGNDGGNTIGNVSGEGWNGHTAITVATEALDDFLGRAGIGKVDFIKIDVEGAESLVFAGARKLLSRPDAPLIVCEVGDPAQRLVGITELDLRKTLYGHDYASYWLDGRKFGPETAVKGLQNIAFAKPRSGAGSAP